jgi:hypothetical protein
MTLRHDLESLSVSDAEANRKELIEFWNRVADRTELREVPGDQVREAEIRVTELLEQGDISGANRITARFIETVCRNSRT